MVSQKEGRDIVLVPEGMKGSPEGLVIILGIIFSRYHILICGVLDQKYLMLWRKTELLFQTIPLLCKVIR